MSSLSMMQVWQVYRVLGGAANIVHREGTGEKGTSEAAVRLLGGNDCEAAYWTWRSRRSTVTTIVVVLGKSPIWDPCGGDG